MAPSAVLDTKKSEKASKYLKHRRLGSAAIGLNIGGGNADEGGAAACVGGGGGPTRIAGGGGGPARAPGAGGGAGVGIGIAAPNGPPST